MTKTLVLTKNQLQIMKNHIVTNIPKEACGIIVGDINQYKEVYRATEIIPAQNVINSSVEFEINPFELYEIYMHAEKLGKEIIGIFHSHPAGTIPSSTDKEFMRVNPYVWLIFDMYTLDYNAYFLDINRDKIIPVKIKIQ